jgi:methionine sulfoxide reductase heme-binding subunit
MQNMTYLLPLFDRQGRFSKLKAVTLFVLVAPLGCLLWRTWTGNLGPLPIKEALHVAGDWTLRFLVVTLALTPAMRIFNWSKLALIRRMAGVGTFCYAALHFILYIVNSKFDIGFVASEIVLRIYLLIGFVALIGLCALAATSTDSAVRKLGQKWKTLHKLVYGIAVLGLLHAFMQYKVDVSPGVLLAGFFVLFMVYRWMLGRRMAWNWMTLGSAALAASIAAMAIEWSWYAIATGVNPWKVLSANFMLGFAVRPSIYVLAAGIAVAIVHVLKPALQQAVARRRSAPQSA